MLLTARERREGMPLIGKLQLLVFIISTILFSVTSAETTILCASTTSTQNSGLFDSILPLFEKETGIKVRVIAVGTGAALEIGKRGDADVVLVHSKDDELRMVREKWFVDRHDVMYNDFVVVGTPSDPAMISGLRNAGNALKKIAEEGALFVSRGDNSGTHKKEMKLWKESGIRPEGKWYLEIGQGMAKTLRIANEKRAYTISDRGTYLTVQDKEKLELMIVVQGDAELLNQYGVMAVNPEKHSHVNYKEAKEFVDWLISDKGQKAIALYRDRNGNQLFHPNANRGTGNRYLR